MRIERYKDIFAAEWNQFICGSKNGTFLFNRSYMDYHSDRFRDHSLMIYNDKNKLLAVLPANESGHIYYSHQGLTYGGFVLSPRIHGKEVLELFDITLGYLKENGFKEFYYRQIPYLYHLIPAQEEEYALWKHYASVVSCGLSSCIDIGSSLDEQYTILKKTTLRKCRQLKKQGYKFVYNTDISLFWGILEYNLKKYHNVSPVHSLEEILLLRERFPENIICCLVYNTEAEIEAGAVLYLTEQTVHIQYMSPSEKGRETQAIKLLVEELIVHFESIGECRYLDFGISTEQGGTVLNEGLLTQKERFGGRGIVYKTWRIDI